MPGFMINGEGQGPSASVDPARTHRFVFRQIGPLSDVILYALSTQRPAPEFDEITIHRGQTEAYLPGKHRWGPINVRFYEILEGIPETTTGALFRYWSGSAGPVNLPRSWLNTHFGKSDVEVDLLDGQGNAAYLYTLYKAWPARVEPSELTYTESTINTVQVTLRFDSATEVESPIFSSAG